MGKDAGATAAANAAKLRADKDAAKAKAESDKAAIAGQAKAEIDKAKADGEASAKADAEKVLKPIRTMEGALGELGSLKENADGLIKKIQEHAARFAKEAAETGL